jgi:spermidine/putrescine transport system permease protein
VFWALIASKELSVTEEKARPAAPLWAVLTSGLVFLFLYFPLAVIAVLSFREQAPSEGWTLRWYQEAMADQSLIRSLGNSLWVALGSTAAATVIGTCAALAIERSSFKGRDLFQSLNLIPLVMPEIVLGLALLIWFVFLQLSLGLFSMTLAHTTFCLSFVIITVRARLKGFDPSVEEAARDLGASQWQVFYRVTLPLMMPGIISGALLAFTLSFDDFLIAYFTGGVGTDTLPVRLYSMIKFGINPTINAMSTMIVGVTALFVLSFILLQETRKRRL